MVLDSSVLISILTGEPDCERYRQAIAESAPELLISAVTLYETAVKLYCSTTDHSLVEDLRDLLDVLAVRVVPFDEPFAWQSLSAYARYGKGIHPARLNLVDCTGYSLAKAAGQALLYKGNDFSQTDIDSAL